MSHTVHPYGQRIGILNGWKSQWFSTNKKGYKQNVKEDIRVREFLSKKLKNNMVDDILIERFRNMISITISTSKPGLLIGRDGMGIENIIKDTKKILEKAGSKMSDKLKVKVEEIKNSEKNANLVAEQIIELLEKRMPFRRVMKQTVEKVAANREVKGVRISLSGRLGGAEIARTEEVKKGSIPLQTLRAEINYTSRKAILSYGAIGIKVWIYTGINFNQK